jgi:hypothetical protein
MPVAITLDQQRSRARGVGPTAELLKRLREAPDIRVAVPFAQAAGDEIQGLVADGDSLVQVLLIAARQGGWWAGVGLGAVEIAAQDVRSSTGPAFEHARHALARAKKLPWGVAAEAGAHRAVRLDRAIALWYSLLLSRTAHGWNVVELRESGKTTAQIAEMLGVTPQAVTKALRAAALRLDVEGRKLVAELLDEAVGAKP